LQNTQIRQNDLSISLNDNTDIHRLVIFLDIKNIIFSIPDIDRQGISGMMDFSLKNEIIESLVSISTYSPKYLYIFLNSTLMLVTFF
jgi:hypothetical protein